MKSTTRLRIRSIALILAAASVALRPMFAHATPAPDELPPAVTVAAPHTVTLAEAIERARQDPPAVVQAIAESHAVESQVSIAHAALLPTATASLTASTSFGSSPTSMLGTSPFSGSGAIDTSINARWTIWDFGRTALATQAAESNVRAARDDVAATERNAMTQAASAYFVLLADGQLVDSYRETARQRAQELEITRGLVQAGTHAPIELTRAQVSLESAQLDVTNAETSTRTDAAAFAAALAFDPAQPVSVAGAPDIAVDTDPVRAAELAAQTRPEVAAARDRLASAESQLSVTHAAFRPSFVASSSLGAGVVGYSNGLDATRESGSFSFGITMPLFDPMLAINVHTAEANVAAARAALDGEVLSVRTDAVQAANQVRAARQSVDQSEQLATVAHANLEQAQGRYNSGVAPLLELVDAQSADQTARIAAIRAQFEFDLAKVRLLAAIGHIDSLAGADSRA